MSHDSKHRRLVDSTELLGHEDGSPVIRPFPVNEGHAVEVSLLDLCLFRGSDDSYAIEVRTASG